MLAAAGAPDSPAELGESAQVWATEILEILKCLFEQASRRKRSTEAIGKRTSSFNSGKQFQQIAAHCNLNHKSAIGEDRRHADKQRITELRAGALANKIKLD